MPSKNQIHSWIDQGLQEDLGDGDVTTNSIVPEDMEWEAEVIAKEPMVVCGIEFFKETFLKLDENTHFTPIVSDGDSADFGDKLIAIKGKAKVLLKAERTALNILQRLSGIATLSHEFSQLAGSVKILDTRKTTPGLRIFEKYAVACGGGQNHRFGLFDAVLIKDNHIRAAGSITEAIRRVRNKLNNSFKIEVEASNLREVEEALVSHADRIMLDNMSIDETEMAIKKIDGKVEIEVSGGVNKELVKKLSGLKIDYISIGALTHSPKAADISMNFL